jgi:single-strand DNA-binding protein
MTNRITIQGRLSADPALKYAATGTAMCSISVPDQKRRKNPQTNEWEDQSATTWFRATVFKDAAEALAEHAKKGDTVIVTGELITREWTNNEGVVKSSLEVDFATVAVVPRAPQAQRQQQAEGDPWAVQAQQGRAQTSPAQATGGWGRPANDEPPF